MTPEQKREYLDSPFHCPYCNSINISTQPLEMGSLDAKQLVSCNDCHEQWNDVYNFNDVEELE